MTSRQKLPGADIPYARYHIVEEGETLAEIASQHYGDETLHVHIFTANRNVLSDPDRIEPGQKLLIP